MHKQDGYLDLKMLSQYSSLAVRTLRDYLADATDPIPSYCIKRKILIKQSEFDDWMKKHRLNNDTISHIVDEVMDGFDAH